MTTPDTAATPDTVTTPDTAAAIIVQAALLLIPQRLPGQVLVDEDDAALVSDEAFEMLCAEARKHRRVLNVTEDGEIVVAERDIVDMKVTSRRGELHDEDGGPELTVRVELRAKDGEGTADTIRLTIFPACNDYDAVFTQWTLAHMTEEERQEVLAFCRGYLGLE
jgi:hypothetical protein